MARVLSTAIVIALLAATAVAFAITESAKLERSPIARTHVDPIFSPDGKLHPVAKIDFVLRKAERIESWIRDADGRSVRTLQEPRAFRSGSRIELVWDGIGDGGIAAPDGIYLPVVKLIRSHRTIVLPNPITLDTKPPVITVHRPFYPILSPDGDGRHDRFVVRYRINEPANAILNVAKQRVELTRFYKPTGELHWNGRFDSGAAKPGRYLMTVQARDLAGNVSKPFPFAIAQIRYIALGRKRVVVKPGGKFALRVSTDVPFVHWKLHGRSGAQRKGTLRFTAPRSAGVYTLYVIAGSHAARCTVVVA